MQFLDIRQQPFRNPHQIWKLVPNNRLEIKKKKLRLTPSYSPERILYNQIELNLVSQQITFVCYVKVTRKIQNISYWYVHPLRKWEKNICQYSLLTSTTLDQMLPGRTFSAAYIGLFSNKAPTYIQTPTSKSYRHWTYLY